MSIRQPFEFAFHVSAYRWLSDHDSVYCIGRPAFCTARHQDSTSSVLLWFGSSGAPFQEPGPTPSILMKSTPQLAKVFAIESAYFCAHGLA